MTINVLVFLDSHIVTEQFHTFHGNMSCVDQTESFWFVGVTIGRKLALLLLLVILSEVCHVGVKLIACVFNAQFLDASVHEALRSHFLVSVHFADGRYGGTWSSKGTTSIIFSENFQ